HRRWHGARHRPAGRRRPRVQQLVDAAGGDRTVGARRGVVKRAGVLALASLALLGAPAGVAASNLALGLGGLQFVLDGGSATGGGGTTTNSTTNNTGGGPAGCTDAMTCPPVPGGPCHGLGMVTCINQVCGVTYGDGGDASSQVYGNCMHNVC